MQLFNLLGRDCEQDGASVPAQDFGELCANFKAVIRPQLRKKADIRTKHTTIHGNKDNLRLKPCKSPENSTTSCYGIKLPGALKRNWSMSW